MPTPAVLPAELTIYAVGEWHPRFLGWLAEARAHGGTLCVDASAVTEADAAGLQLLVALSNALARHDQPLQLDAPSAVLADTCMRLGADFLLSLHPAPETA